MRHPRFAAAILLASSGCLAEEDRRFQASLRRHELMYPHLMEARKAFAAGDPKGALLAIEKVLALDRDPEEVSWSQWYEDHHEFSQESPSSDVGDALAVRAQAREALGDWDGAEADYYAEWRACGFPAPQFPSWNTERRTSLDDVRRARSLPRLNDLSDVIRASGGPELVEALLRRGECLLERNETGDVANARDNFDRAQALAPDDLRPACGVARCHWMRHEREEAARRSLVVLERAPKLHWFPYHCLDSMAQEAGQSAIAVDLLSQAIALDATRPEPRAMRARALVALTLHLESAAANASPTPPPVQAEPPSRDRAADLEMALADCTIWCDKLKDQQDAIDAWVLRIRIYLLRKEFDRALRCADFIGRRGNPDLFEPLYLHAIAGDEINQELMARTPGNDPIVGGIWTVADYERLHELDPRHPYVSYRLAMAYIASAERSQGSDLKGKALRMYRIAMRNDPNMAPIDLSGFERDIAAYQEGIQEERSREYAAAVAAQAGREAWWQAHQERVAEQRTAAYASANQESSTVAPSDSGFLSRMLLALSESNDIGAMADANSRAGMRLESQMRAEAQWNTFRHDLDRVFQVGPRY